MKFNTLAACLATTLAAAAPAAAWEPDGPIMMEIGFDAGGETDTLGRLIAQAMEEQTGWDVVVENKPGGGGIAMFTGLAAQAPDGQTIGVGVTMPVLINLVLRGDELPFDLDSFDYLATIARAQLAIVSKADAPFDDIPGLVEFSKANDGALVAFDAKPQELMTQIVNDQTGAGMRLVSTKSSAEMVQNVLGGHVHASYASGAHIPFLDSGELKMLASANADRHGYAPEVATLIEQGYDTYTDPYFYVAAPAGLPEDAAAALSGALNAAINSDGVRAAIENTMQTQPSDLGPEGTRAKLFDDLANVQTLFGG